MARVRVRAQIKAEWSLRVALALGSLPFVVSCGPHVQSVVVSQQVSVVLVNMAATHETPAIDPNDPRIAKAGAAIADILGHPLRFEVDAALARRFGASLHEQLVSAMEEAVDGLEASKRRSPDAFALAAPSLKTIAIDYGPAAEEPPPTLDTTTGVFHVVLSPTSERLLSGYDLLDAFAKNFDDAMERKYDGRAPESIAPAEQAAYVLYALHHRAAHRGDPQASLVDEGARVRSFLKLYDHVTDPALKAKLREQILSLAHDLTRGVPDDAPPPAANVASLLEAARSGFIAWANARAGEWSPAERAQVTETIFSTGAYFEAKNRLFRRGFDVVAFARPLVAVYVEEAAAPVAGARRNGQGDTRSADVEKTDRTIATVLCPLRPPHGDDRWYGNCSKVLYEELMAKPDGARRLAAWVLEVKSDAFTTTVASNVMDSMGITAAAALVDALLVEGNAGHAASVALHAFAGASSWGSRSRSPDLIFEPDPFVARLLGWYRAHPPLHGPVVYVLTRIGRDEAPKIAWGHLATLLGAPLSAEDYGAFLDQGPEAMWSVDLLTKVLSAGWSRTAAILPRFERFLNTPAEDPGGPDRFYLAERLVRSLCDDGTFADIKAFQAFAHARVEAYPDEERIFGNALKAPGELCPEGSPARASQPRKGAPPLTFGD